MKADGVELDVHSTKDGGLVVHHDPDLPGRGPIGSLMESAAREFRLPNGERLPVLAEALAVLGDLEVWIEVKTLDPAFDHRLLQAIDESQFPKHRAVHSFDHRIVARLGSLRPALRRGVLSASYFLDPLQLLKSVGAETLWQEASLIDGDLVERLHGGGGKIIAWTVNSDHEAERLARLGVDGLCGNYPDRLLAAVKRGLG